MRKLMWFTVGFGAVCAICAYLPVLWPVPVAIGLLLISCILRVFNPEKVWIRIVSLVLLGGAVGFGWFAGYDGIYLAPARAADGTTVSVSVTASDYSVETDYGCRVDGFMSLDGRFYRIRAYLNTSQQIQPGDRIEGHFRLRFTSDGGQREPAYQRGEGIFLILSQRGDPEWIPAESLPWYGYPTLWHAQLLSAIDKEFPQDAAGFAKALLLGFREDLDYSVESDFKATGILHIIAVSALHVSILFGLLYTLTFRKRVLTFLISTPVLVLFAAVVGFTPSVTRACIMQILMMLAILVEREYDPPTELSFSVMVMLVINPLAITSASFQLSVSCMVGIFLFSGRIRQWILDPKRLGGAKGKNFFDRLKRWFAGSVSITLGTMVTTTPLLAYYFSGISLIGPLTNLLTLWVISFVFYGIILCCLLSLLGFGIAGAIAQLIAWPIHYVIMTSDILADFPLAAISTQSVYVVIWLVFCYLLLAVYVVSKKKHALVFTCSIAISLCLALTASWTEPMLYECYVSVLDVGQGQCVLLQSEGKAFLVDCGGDYGEGAANVAAQTLLARGIHRLDGIILTHYDEDHAGGIPYLLNRVDTQLLIMPDSEDDSGIKEELIELAGENAVLLRDDLQIRYQNSRIHIIRPVSLRAGNESSLCILFETENCDILITGDRDELGELLLLRQTELPQLDVLIVGHHGSASSTSQQLLAATSPEIAIISVGEDNRYGHPAKAVLDRLAEYGCQIYRTDEHGTVIFRR